MRYDLDSLFGKDTDACKAMIFVTGDAWVSLTARSRLGNHVPIILSHQPQKTMIGSKVKLRRLDLINNHLHAAAAADGDQSILGMNIADGENIAH